MSLKSYLLEWTKWGITQNDFVLEVGSGGRPCARSDVLCDMYIDDNIERGEGNIYQSILIDRPFVCANAEYMPFKDKTFDFFISIHTLEHIIHPEGFLNEAMRVSKRGLIITPSELCERMMPRATHLWMVSNKHKKLILQQKTKVNESDMPGDLHIAWAQDKEFRRFFERRNDLFETHFYFDDDFEYEIYRHNGTFLPDWMLIGDTNQAEKSTHIHHTETMKKKLERSIRSFISTGIRSWHSSKSPPSISEILICPYCKGGLTWEKTEITCRQCLQKYPIRPDGIPVLIRTSST